MKNENNYERKKSELKLSSGSFIPKSIDTKIPFSLSNNNITNNFSNHNIINFNNFTNQNFYGNLNLKNNIEKNKFDNENYNNLNNEINNINNTTEINHLNSIFDGNITRLLKENKPIKISLDTNVKNTISSIVDYLEKDENETVYLTGLNFAISKVILIAEIVKIKIRNLHQINNMDCLIANNSYKINKESDEGDIKRIPKFEIILTKKEPLEKGFGYQSPLTDEEIKILSDRYLEKTTQNIKEKILKRDFILIKRINRLRLIPKRRRMRILKKDRKYKLNKIKK